MIGLFVLLAGWLSVVVGFVLLFGVWPLVAAGVLTMAVGAFVDLDRVKESPNAKRRQQAP
jgi:hypothetical protein